MACFKYIGRSSAVRSCQALARNNLVISQLVQSYSHMSNRNLLHRLPLLLPSGFISLALLPAHSAMTTSNTLVIKNNRLTQFEEFILPVPSN